MSLAREVCGYAIDSSEAAGIFVKADTDDVTGSLLTDAVLITKTCADKDIQI